jgi:hypothetical protein
MHNQGRDGFGLTAGTGIFSSSPRPYWLWDTPRLVSFPGTSCCSVELPPPHPLYALCCTESRFGLTSSLPLPDWGDGPHAMRYSPVLALTVSLNLADICLWALLRAMSAVLCGRPSETKVSMSPDPNHHHSLYEKRVRGFESLSRFSLYWILISILQEPYSGFGHNFK